VDGVAGGLGIAWSRSRSTCAHIAIRTHANGIDGSAAKSFLPPKDFIPTQWGLFYNESACADILHPRVKNCCSTIGAFRRPRGERKGIFPTSLVGAGHVRFGSLARLRQTRISNGTSIQSLRRLPDWCIPGEEGAR
jgi:hypothetical protein